MKAIIFLLIFSLSFLANAGTPNFNEVSSLIDRRASVGVLAANNGENVYISDITYEYSVKE